MGEQDHRSTLVEQFANGRHDALDAGRIAHFALLDGHVEIDADDDALALGVELIEGLEGSHQRFFFLTACRTALAVMPKCG